jgi:hypothetical protein
MTVRQKTLKTLKLFSTESLLTIIGSLLIWFFLNNKSSQEKVISQQQQIIDKLDNKVSNLSEKTNKNIRDIALIKEHLKMNYEN